MIDEKKLILHLNDWMLQESFSSNLMTPADVISKCIEAVKEQPKGGEWIPCSERLPEDNQVVIVCFAHGLVTALHFYNNKFHGVHDYDERVIVAWQPFPEVYHEQTDKKGNMSNDLISRSAAIAIIEKQRLLTGKQNLFVEYNLANIQDEIEKLPVVHDADKQM